MERPLLSPHNLRLRHLKAVHVRNLTFARPRAQTIDDVDLNTASSSKLAAVPESPSFTTDDIPSRTQGRPAQLRRRSTNWAGKSPSLRHRRLEEVIENGVADSFFSIHCQGLDEPIHISEVVIKSMNPNFRDFDLSEYGPAIRRSAVFRIKLWIKRRTWLLFLDQEINMCNLSFMGKLDTIPLPNNALLFRLQDTWYSLALPTEYPPPKAMPSQPTSSYNALMRLATLDDSIQDALTVQRSLIDQINKIIQPIPEDHSAMAQDSASRALDYVAMTKRLLKTSVRRRTVLSTQIKARQSGIERGRTAQQSVWEDVSAARGKLVQDHSILGTTDHDIHGQRRRICEDLLRVFPIEPTSTPLLFTICGLSLPNTSFDDSDVDSDDLYSAALGYVARLVDMLQYYFFVALPYPVTAYGSRSVVADPISVLPDNQRIFPLYTKGIVRFRFDYAVFLMNKNIECLIESQGCKVMDIRHTLPNLKFLLYIGSAGAGELPSRKAGGVRGLVTGRSSSSLLPIASKTFDDNNGCLSSTPQGNDEAALVGPDGRMFKRAGPTSPTLRQSANISLRTKGLRENVVS